MSSLAGDARAGGLLQVRLGAAAVHAVLAGAARGVRPGSRRPAGSLPTSAGPPSDPPSPWQVMPAEQLKQHDGCRFHPGTFCEDRTLRFAAKQARPRPISARSPRELHLVAKRS